MLPPVLRFPESYGGELFADAHDSVQLLLANGENYDPSGGGVNRGEGLG